MYLQRFFVEGLAHASYLFGAEGEAAVVDPKRDSISSPLQLMVTPVLCTSRSEASPNTSCGILALPCWSGRGDGQRLVPPCHDDADSVKLLSPKQSSQPTTNGDLPMNNYVKFGAMIATSTVVMFVLMYLNTYQSDHVFFSETRAYMAVVMGASMAVIMLAFMLGMYSNGRANAAILGGSVIVFAVALWFVRSQATVEEVSWMKAMIPHHSIAILTSERAHISDPRVRKLADTIIESQRKEIGEMKALIKELEAKR
jgi:hypothetical protein